MFKFKSKYRNRSTKATQTNLLSDKQPFAYTEAYKALRTNLKFMTLGGQLKKLVITSAIPGEGKTTFVLNLAKTLADSGKKVIVVDADLRNPSIHKYLRVRQSMAHGLSALLAENEVIEKSIGRLDKLNFDVILSGQIPPNPAELLGSGKMASILDHLEKSYDYVICDAPPVSIVTDAVELSQSCDGVIMVVAQGMASQQQVLSAKYNLLKVDAHILGAVLTNYDVALNNQADSEEYAYYYGYKEH